MPDDPRPPGYHSRRWYKKHPEAKQPSSQGPQHSPSMQQLKIQEVGTEAKTGDRSVLSRSSVEAYAFFFVTIILTVVPMAWYVRGFGLLVLIPLTLDLVRRSPYTHGLERSAKIPLYVLAVLVPVIIGLRVLPNEYKKDHPPRSALVITARAQK